MVIHDLARGGIAVRWVDPTVCQDDTLFGAILGQGKGGESGDGEKNCIHLGG